MQKVTTVCDVCGQQKGEANHWLGGTIMADGKLKVSIDGPCDLDLCGESCAHKLLSRFLNERLNPPAAAEAVAHG